MEQYCLSPPPVPPRPSSVASEDGNCSVYAFVTSPLRSMSPQQRCISSASGGGVAGNMYWPDSWGQPPINTSLEYELSPPAQLSAHHHNQLISPVEINSPQSAHQIPIAADNLNFRVSSAATPIRVEVSPSPPPVLMQSSQLPATRLRIQAPSDALQIVTLDHKGTLQQLLCGRFWRDRFILLSGGRIQIYLTEQAYRMRQVPLQSMDLKGAEMRFFSTRSHHLQSTSSCNSPQQQQPPQPRSYGFALVQRKSRVFLLFRGSPSFSSTSVSPSNMTSSASPALSISSFTGGGSGGISTPNNSNSDAQVLVMNGWIQAIKDALERANPPARSPMYSQDDLIPWFRVHTPHEALRDILPTPKSKPDQPLAPSPMHQKGCEDCGVEFVESATAFFKQFCAHKRAQKSFEAPPAAFLPRHQHKAAAPPRPKSKQKGSNSKRTWGTEKRFLCAHCNNAFCKSCSSNRLYVPEFLRAASPTAAQQQRLNPRLTPPSAGKPKHTQWPSQAILYPPVLGIHSPPHASRKPPPPRELHHLCTLCCRLLSSIRFLPATSTTPSFFLTSPPMQQQQQLLLSESLDQGLANQRSDGSMASVATQRNSLFSPSVDSIATTMSPFSAASTISPQPALNGYPGLPPLGNPIDLTAPHCCVPSSRAMAQPMMPESAIVNTRAETPADRAVTGLNAKDNGVVSHLVPRLGLNAPKYQVFDAIPSRSLCSSAPLPSNSPCPVKEEDVVVTVVGKTGQPTPSKPIPIVQTNPAMKKQQSQRQLRNIATSLGITPLTPIEQKMQVGKVNNCPVPKHQTDPSTNKASQKSKAGCCIM